MESNVTDLESYRRSRAQPDDTTALHPVISDEVDYSNKPPVNPERQAIIDDFAHKANVLDDGVRVTNKGRLLRLINTPEPPDSAA